MSQDLVDRITRLETKVDERWTAHDKRSDERWSDISTKIGTLFEKMTCLNKAYNDLNITLTKAFGELPCKERDIRYKGFQQSISAIWGLLLVIVGWMWWLMRLK